LHYQVFKIKPPNVGGFIVIITTHKVKTIAILKYLC
jgi:hypothetical protein